MDEIHPLPHTLVIGEKNGIVQRLVQGLLREQLSIIHAYTADEADKHSRGKHALIVADLGFLEAHDIRMADMSAQASEALWIFLLPPGRDQELSTLLTQPNVFYALKSPWTEHEAHALILRALQHSALLFHQQELQQKTQQLQERLACQNTSQDGTKALGQIVRSEKMVILGQMVAGIAHEINTPSGAINAAVVNMRHHLKELMQGVEQLERANITRENVNNIVQIVREMVNTLDETQRKSSGEIRIEQRRLMDRLDRQDIQNSRKVAKDIARMGLSRHTDTLLDLAGAYGTGDIFSFFMHCNRIITSTKDIQLSIGVLTRIVQALKAYSYPKTDTLELANIHDSLETAVTLLTNKFKHQVHVELHLGEIPEIYCYPGELSHVWINIINNAIQAIEDKGRIDIESFQTQDHVGVRVRDTGCGIPAEILDRIFDINFTTKDRNEGTGLGLYIARQIVDKHHGSITVSSSPGQTVFEVLLPLNLND